jgi:hypothetical protein
MDCRYWMLSSTLASEKGHTVVIPRYNEEVDLCPRRSGPFSMLPFGLLSARTSYRSLKAISSSS